MVNIFQTLLFIGKKIIETAYHSVYRTHSQRGIMFQANDKPVIADFVKETFKSYCDDTSDIENNLKVPAAEAIEILLKDKALENHFELVTK